MIHPESELQESLMLRARNKELGAALREEGIGGDLGRLAPGGIILPAEVWTIARTTRFAHTPARIAAHDSSGGQSLYPYVERIGRRHIFIRLRGGWVREARSVRHDLGNLSASGVGSRPEIRETTRP